MQTLSTRITNSLHVSFSSMQNYLARETKFILQKHDGNNKDIGLAPSAMNIHSSTGNILAFYKRQYKIFLCKEKYHLVYIVTDSNTIHNYRAERRKILHRCQPTQGTNYKSHLKHSCKYRYTLLNYLSLI